MSSRQDPVRCEAMPFMQTKKILVVEDDEVTQKLFSDALKSAGYEVFTASDASTAVKVARTEQPDLITLDINLSMNSPGDSWDGFTVAGWVRRLNESKSVRIVVISGSQEPGEVVEKAAIAGVNTFLPKPVSKAQLLKVVADTLK